jgi:hypothetical protein
MAFNVTGYFKAGGKNFKPGDTVENLDPKVEAELLALGRIESDATKAPADPAAQVAPAPAAPAAPAAPQQPNFAQQIANDPQLQ